MAGGLDFAKFLDPLGLFRKDKKETPSPQAAPKSPTEDLAAKQARESAAEEERRKAAASGSASTQLAGLGDPGYSSATKTLLGA